MASRAPARGGASPGPSNPPDGGRPRHGRRRPGRTGWYGWSGVVSWLGAIWGATLRRTRGRRSAVRPAQPAKPAKPAQPAKPAKPAQPAKPAKSAQPAKPAKSGQPAKAKAKPGQQAEQAEPGSGRRALADGLLGALRRAGTRGVPARPSAYVALVAVVAVLNLIGLVMVLSASSVQALRDYNSSWFFFKRQVLWTLAGGLALAVTSRLDYRRWRPFVRPLLFACLLLLALVLVPGLGISVSGSSRWLGAGSLRIQPSELTKLAVALFCADLLTKRASRMRDPKVTVGPVLVVLGVVAVLVMLQPDMGTSIVVGGMVLTVLFVAGAPLPTMALVMAGGVAGAFLLGMLEPYRRARMVSFLDPWADAVNGGYQLVQSLVGLGSGKITGLGLGASRAKWGFLPNAHTDFIFAILGEELGLVGSLLVVALFATFALLGVRTALRAPDRFGTLVAAAVTAWVVGQALVNMGAVIGLLPVTGVPLPFVSFGGSSLVIAMGAVGILLNVSRSSFAARAPAPDEERAIEHDRAGEGHRAGEHRAGGRYRP